MPYVAKDDIMAFIGSNVTVTAGTPKNVELILYKDYIIFTIIVKRMLEQKVHLIDLDRQNQYVLEKN